MEVPEVKEEVVDDLDASNSNPLVPWTAPFPADFHNANPSPTTRNECFKQLRSMVDGRVQKWKYDFLRGKEMHPLASVMRDKPKPKIEVGVEPSGKVFASIECVLCNRFIKLFICSSQWNEGVTYIKNANYTRHLKAHFKE